MAPTAEEELTLTYHSTPSGKLSIITLNRPQKYNALGATHYRLLASLMHQVDADDSTIATLLIGTGKFFSAGADFTAITSRSSSLTSSSDATDDARMTLVSSFAKGNLNITNEFSNHRHPLFVCLNGPAIGLSASLTAFGDFIYATPPTYLLTPFSSLGLVPEGGASLMFPLKMGIALASRALIVSDKLTCEELVKAGYVTRVFPFEGFKENCIRAVEAAMEDKNVESMRRAKAFMLESVRKELAGVNAKEVFGAVDRFEAGIPQQQFARLARKEKRHKV